MKKNLSFFTILIFIISGCVNQLRTIDQCVVCEESLKKYTEKFNENDNEIYIQHYNNQKAYEFLSKNIPLISLPNKDIEETYYFRWWTFRKHIKNTADGYVITEFLPKVYWSKKHNTINCPAAHHIYEGRWLRDEKYIQDYINFWLQHSEDGIRQYSFWVADAVLAFQNIHKNESILLNQLAPLIDNYKKWEETRKDPGKDLFFQWDVADGMELTASGQILNNGNEIFGIPAVRPTINSYMYGDAHAISKIAKIAGDSLISSKYYAKAQKIKYEVQDKLWNENLNFFTVLPRNYDSNSSPLNVRELIGYVPWYFNLPDDSNKYENAWKKVKDSLGFAAPYGLTVTEQSHPYFKVSYEGHECQWNGPSWPFASTQTLKALSNFLNNYSNNNVINKSDYFKLLNQYAKSHRIKDENGNYKNWIDENLNPFTGDWISRTRLKNWDNKGWSIERGGVERGKDYNHSGFCDLVISDLLGIKPYYNNYIEINPLIPDDWDWFAIEKIKYQDKFISVIWDRTGKKFNVGKGLLLIVDNKIVDRRKKIEKIIYKFEYEK